jgi:hypothetical protein
MAEAFRFVGVDPARQRIKPARQRLVGMNPAAEVSQKNARAVAAAREKDRSPGLGVFHDELRLREFRQEYVISVQIRSVSSGCRC